MKEAPRMRSTTPLRRKRAIAESGAEEWHKTEEAALYDGIASGKPWRYHHLNADFEKPPNVLTRSNIPINTIDHVQNALQSEKRTHQSSNYAVTCVIPNPHWTILLQAASQLGNALKRAA